MPLGRPAGSDHPTRRRIPASDAWTCHILDHLLLCARTARRGARPEYPSAGRSEDPHTITRLGREPIQTHDRAVLSRLEEPGWTPLPNVLRLSCGAKSRSETNQRLPYRRPGGLGGTASRRPRRRQLQALVRMRPFPLGAKPCTHGNRQLRAGLSLWAAPPVPTICPGWGYRSGSSDPNTSLDYLLFATEAQGGAPDQSTRARGGANSSRTITAPAREPIQIL